MTQQLQSIHQEALTRFDLIWSSVSDERELAITDRRFVGVSGAQWEGELETLFANRPKIEVDKVSLAVQRVVSEYRANRITVDFTSKNGEDGDGLAEVCDGLYRADEQYSGAKEAYDTAFQEGVTGGYGAWRFLTEYEDEFDDENEHQRIKIEPIYDADKCVFFDLNAKRQDKSDAQYCFVISGMSREAYETEYQDSVPSWQMDDRTRQFDWALDDLVYIAEYYLCRVVEEAITVVKRVDGSEVEYTDEELEDNEDLLTGIKAAGGTIARTKKVKRKQVVKYMLSGGKVLCGPEVIAGKNIPIVPFYGRRAYIDNLERCSGVVRRSKDVQRLKNILLSKVAEQSASAPDEKPIFAPEQIDATMAETWANANVDNPAFLMANPLLDEQGNVVAAGPVGYTKPPALDQATAVLTQTVDQDLSEVLGNQQAGEEINTNTSGKAIELVQNRLDMQSYEYMDNMAKAMKRGGEIWLGMAREIYVEDGRKMKTIGPQKEIQSIVLGDKVLSKSGEVVSEGDLTRANFDVNVEVGPSSASKRQSMVKNLIALQQVTADQETSSVISAMILMNMEGEGMQDIHEWQRKRLVAQGVLKPTEGDMREAQQAQEAQTPDPNSMFLMSEAEKNAAQAEKLRADTEKSLAQAQESRANTAETLAGIGRDDRQQVINLASELDRDVQGQSARPQNSASIQGIPPGQIGRVR